MHKNARIAKYVKNNTILFKSLKSNAIRGSIYANKNSDDNLFAFRTFKTVPVGFCLEHSRFFKKLLIPIILIITIVEMITMLRSGIILSLAKLSNLYINFPSFGKAVV